MSTDWYETPSELSVGERAQDATREWRDVRATDGPAPRPHPDGPCRYAGHGCAVCAQMERLYHVGRDAAAQALAGALDILRGGGR